MKNVFRTLLLLLALSIVLVLLLDHEEGRPAARHFSDPFLAAQYGGLESLRRMVKDDPDVVRRTNHLGWTPLHLAAKGNRPEAAEYLISNGAEIDARDTQQKTPLHEAAWHGWLDVAKILVRHGADVNARDDGWPTGRDNEGRNVLSWATWGGNVELVKFLLEKGAKIE